MSDAKFIVIFEDVHPSLEGDVFGPFGTMGEADAWASSLPDTSEYVSWEIWPLRAPTL